MGKKPWNPTKSHGPFVYLPAHEYIYGWIRIQIFLLFGFQVDHGFNVFGLVPVRPFNYTYLYIKKKNPNLPIPIPRLSLSLSLSPSSSRRQPHHVDLSRSHTLQIYQSVSSQEFIYYYYFFFILCVFCFIFCCVGKKLLELVDFVGLGYGCLFCTQTL